MHFLGTCEYFASVAESDKSGVSICMLPCVAVYCKCVAVIAVCCSVLRSRTNVVSRSACYSVLQTCCSVHGTLCGTFGKKNGSSLNLHQTIIDFFNRRPISGSLFAYIGLYSHI